MQGINTLKNDELLLLDASLNSYIYFWLSQYPMTQEKGPLRWLLVCLPSSLVKVVSFDVHRKSRSRSEIFPVTNLATVSLTLPQFKPVSSVPESANLSFFFGDHTISNLVFTQTELSIRTDCPVGCEM